MTTDVALAGVLLRFPAGQRANRAYALVVSLHAAWFLCLALALLADEPEQVRQPSFSGITQPRA